MINWNKKLQAPGVAMVAIVRTSRGDIRRLVTVSDAHEILSQHGLTITTAESVNWGTRYPAEASHLTRICILQQRIADLRHRLRSARAGRRALP